MASLAVALSAVVLFGATYVLPWYPASVLPAAVLAASAVPRRALYIGSGALLVAYAVPPGMMSSDHFAAAQAAHLCGLALAAMVLVVVAGRLTPKAPTGGL